MFSVRPPLPRESSIVAELVLQSDCGMLPALFGPDVGALVARLQSAAANPYSSGNTLVIANDASSIVGALVGSRMDSSRGTNLHTAVLLLGWYGPAVLARLPRLGRAGRAIEALAFDDFYLSHIAVLPAERGRGAGRELLHAGEAHARQLGACRVVLDVEEHNEGARAFYGRMGYSRLSDFRIDLGTNGSFAFERLGRALTGPFPAAGRVNGI
jgi:ribosomal protein S18 acetylase RimI-like enzyme